jgi:hypothetical protein
MQENPMPEKDPGSPAVVRSWRPEVQTDSTGKWYGNGLRFATREEAEANALDLSLRWFAVREWRAVEDDNPVNYRYVDHKLEAAP